MCVCVGVLEDVQKNENNLHELLTELYSSVLLPNSSATFA